MKKAQAKGENRQLAIENVLLGVRGDSRILFPDSLFWFPIELVEAQYAAPLLIIDVELG